jgi:hypothetical protein
MDPNVLGINRGTLTYNSPFLQLQPIYQAHTNVLDATFTQLLPTNRTGVESINMSPQYSGADLLKRSPSRV